MKTVAMLDEFHSETEELHPAATTNTNTDKTENIYSVNIVKSDLDEYPRSHEITDSFGILNHPTTTINAITLEKIPKIETDEHNLWSDSDINDEPDQDPFAGVEFDPNFVICASPPSDLTVKQQKTEKSTETSLTSKHPPSNSKQIPPTRNPATINVENSSQFQFVCKLCLTKLSSQNDLKSHLRLCSTTPKDRRFFCVDCNTQYASSFGFKNHNLKVHRRGIEPNRPEFYRVQFKCQFCPLIYVLREKFKIHTESHLKNLDVDTAMTAQNDANLQLKLNPYKCEKCGSTFNTVTGLSDHVRACESKDVDSIFKCPDVNCRKIFNTKGKLIQHFKIHSDNRPFQCPEPNCGKRFKFKQHMKGHMTCHFKWKLIICFEPNCSKTFRTEGDLKKHKQLHKSGDNARPNISKPFACSECHMTFSLNWRLTTHVNLVHRKGDPFRCPHPECGKTFKYENSLNIHVKGFHGDGETEPFKCPHPGCNFACKKKSYVKVHVKTHTGERPFKCTVVEDCSKTFTISSHLKRHIREKHMENILY